MPSDNSPYMFTAGEVARAVESGTRQEVRLPPDLHGVAGGAVGPYKGQYIRLRPFTSTGAGHDVPAQIIQILPDKKIIVGPRDD